MDAFLDTQIYRPGPPLVPYVDCIWYRRGFIPNRRREYSMPTGSVDLVFNLNADRIRVFESAADLRGLCMNGAVVHGPQARSFVIDNLEHVHFVGVHFRAGGACMLGLPLQYIADRHVSFDELWGGAARVLRDRLLECTSARAMFDVLERELTAHLHASRLVNPAISFALRAIKRGSELESLRRETGYSERRFTNLFEEAVGLTPKKFARVQRLNRALRQLAQGRHSLASVAAEEGYYDHAHLTREFRDLTGIAPSLYKPMQRSPLHMEVD